MAAKRKLDEKNSRFFSSRQKQKQTKKKYVRVLEKMSCQSNVYRVRIVN